MALEWQNTWFDTLNDPAFNRPLVREQLARVGVNEPRENLGQYGYLEYWLDRPARPGQFYTLEAGDRVEQNNRVEQVDLWVAWEPATIRQVHQQTITENRLAADVLQIDLRADAGRAVLMDEANALAESKTNELTGTADGDLEAFDPSFDPLQIGSLVTASSLYNQTAQVLATDPTLTVQQRTDLEAVQAAYAQIVLDGDDAAAVPAVPDDSRLKIGVVAEGYGQIRCHRFFEAGWWWLEFELQTDRELSVRDYWIAVYSEGTYLTTPQLAEVAENVYRADRLAVNLPHNKPQQYEYTLCHQHISNQMFSPVVLGEDVDEAIALVRWGGNAA